MPYYIEDLIDLEVCSQIELGANLIIRIASKEEQMLIKSLISKFGYTPGLEPSFYRHHEYIFRGKPSGGMWEVEKRLEQDFRYFVLDEVEPTGQYNQIYAKAFLLTDSEFFIPFGFNKMTKPIGGVITKYSFDSELSCYSYFYDNNVKDNKFEKLKTFSDKDKKQVQSILTLIQTFDKVKESYPYVNKAFEDFFKISEISDRSVFKVVSYFACLELLLVDNSFDKLKSIRLQLETKLDLLNNRISQPIVVSDFVQGPDTLTLGKIVGVAYGYRSSIAHGDFVDFEKKLQILSKISKLEILTFLRTILKRILIYAIKDPQLIADLKKC